MKPIPKKKRISLAEQVDAIGNRYESAQLKIDEGMSEANICKEEVKSLAATSEHSHDSAKGKCVSGNAFVVGYFDRGGTPKFDEARFSVEHPQLYAKCTVMRRMFDEALFEDAVTKGTISRALVKKYLVRTGVTRVAYVKRKSAKE